MPFFRRSQFALIVAFSFGIGAATARASDVPRSFFQLPSSNGRGAVVVDLQAGRATQFREHLFSSEEPLLDVGGNEVWSGGKPQTVSTRDLLHDAYWGVRAFGSQRWLTTIPPNLDQSGYDGFDSSTGGTGLVRVVHDLVSGAGALRATQYFFSPMSGTTNGASFVMALQLENLGGQALTDVAAFSLHNLRLGPGRPGPHLDLAESGETVFTSSGSDLYERAFAGVVAARPLFEGTTTRAASLSNDSPSLFSTVDAGGAINWTPFSGTSNVGTGWTTGFQFAIGTLSPGQSRWAAVVLQHHANPFADVSASARIDSVLADITSPAALVTRERNFWKAVQESAQLPAGLSTDEERLFRQSLVMLKMAQVQESATYLREWNTNDGDPRRTRFASPSALPGEIAHLGTGAMVASLPPGEWAIPWPRDGAYAIAALAKAGLHAEAKEALTFLLTAEANRFHDWSELNGYALPPYQISLARYYGFGVEETDFNDFGPNLEFDGFGLFLWALRAYVDASGDSAFVHQHYDAIVNTIAAPILALTDTTTNLLRADSSIWETHWNGRQRQWAYSNIVSARGLCDLAALAQAEGDTARATTFRTAGIALRQAILQRLTSPDGVLASNREELVAGSGYMDAATLDAIAMGLVYPQGVYAEATLDAMDASLRTAAGIGWARNDDRYDHPGAEDLSPWGSEYDSAEWVFPDLRGVIALHAAGRDARGEALLNWITEQSTANYGAIAETYDENLGTYKFNAPMVGFGAGAYILALAQRNVSIDPACGAFPDAPPLGSGGAGAAAGGAAGAGGASLGAGGNGGRSASQGGAALGSEAQERDASGCACSLVGKSSAPRGSSPWAWAHLGLAAFMARARRVMRIHHLLVPLVSLTAALLFADALRAEASPKPIQSQQSTAPRPRTPIDFSAAKVIAAHIYGDHRVTFYCGCAYSPQRDVSAVSCGYAPRAQGDRKRKGNPKNPRSTRIEWEHIVPASAFGAHRACWTHNKPGTDSRTNCRKTDEEFRAMEADLVNLVPAIGEVNQARSNFLFGEIDGESREFGACDFEVDKVLRIAEPAPALRGMIARIYLRMYAAWGSAALPLSDDELARYRAWDVSMPPSAWELERARRIDALQYGMGITP